MSGLFFKYRCEGCRLPSPGGQPPAGERVTCRVHRAPPLATRSPSPRGRRPPRKGLGECVIITIAYHHNNRVFRGNTSSPADPFACCSSVPSGGGTPLRLRLRCPQGCRRSRGETLLLLSVVLAESTAQLFSLFVFLLFFIF